MIVPEDLRSPGREINVFTLIRFFFTSIAYFVNQIQLPLGRKIINIFRYTYVYAVQNTYTIVV